MKRILALMDSEEGYAERFMEYVNRRRSAPFEVHAFTDFEELRTAMQTQQAAVLLISEKDAREEIRRWNLPDVILLSDRREAGEHSVYQYQSASEVMRKVLEACADSRPPLQKEALQAPGCRVIGVFSPIGRCGKTSLSLTLGLLLAASKETLYLSLEQNCALAELLHTEFTRSLSDGIYYLRSGDPNAAEKLLAAAGRIGELGYLPPFASPEELFSVTEEEWGVLIGEILRHGRYEAVILDLDRVPYCCPEVLSLCDLVLEVVRTDAVSQAKAAEYRSFLKKRNLSDLQEKLKEVCLPEMEEIRETDRYPELLPYGPIGNAAKEMIRIYDL